MFPTGILLNTVTLRKSRQRGKEEKEKEEKKEKKDRRKVEQRARMIIV
jgi:hypothetical protein